MCASKGSIIVPIKSKDMLKFLGSWAGRTIGGDAWIGLQNMKEEGYLAIDKNGNPIVTSKLLEGYFYSDGEPFNDTGLAQLGLLRIKGSCFGLKAAVGFEVREMKCNARAGTFCEWTGRRFFLQMSSC